MKKPESTQELLLPEFTIHCFFRCKHVVRAYDPQEAHDLMEQHYADKHAAQIAALTGNKTAEATSLQQEREAFCAQHGHIFFTNHPGCVTTENRRCTMCGAYNPRKHKEARNG